jgi:Tfp pilus assembly protein PilN
VRAAESRLSNLQDDLNQVHAKQHILSEKLELRKELQAREQLIASIGFPVQITRLLQTLDSVMPREMSLTEFNCQIEEQLRAAPPAAGRGAADKEQQIDRRLNVKLAGVTPSDVDLANLLAGLTDVPFFDQVSVTYARSKVESGHVMREFEITFSMSLNRQTSAS